MRRKDRETERERREIRNMLGVDVVATNIAAATVPTPGFKKKRER